MLSSISAQLCHDLILKQQLRKLEVVEQQVSIPSEHKYKPVWEADIKDTMLRKCNKNVRRCNNSRPKNKAFRCY